MTRKAAVYTALLALIALPACSRNVTCKNLASKNKKCSEEFISYVKAQKKKDKSNFVGSKSEGDKKGALEKSFQKYLTRMGKKTADAFGGAPFMERCKPLLKKDSSEGKKLQECFKTNDCEAYVKCLSEIEGIKDLL